MQNIPTGLIPYNHQKYLTGKYIAETRGGFRPPQVVKMEGALQPIIYIDKEGCASCCNDNGAWSGVNSEFDLFLRPKTVKKWHPVFEDWLFDSEEKCKEESLLYKNPFIKAVEVEVNED